MNAGILRLKDGVSKMNEQSGNNGVLLDETVTVGERERSTIQFPYMNLSDALDLVKSLHGNVGVGMCTEDQLAAWMNLSPKSSGFRIRIATAKLFGFIDSAGVGSFALSGLGKAVVDPSQERKAKVEAFLNVPLYKLAYDNYKGGVVPPAAAFERDIKSWGVAAKQTARARQVFERSADDAGFYESGRNRLVIPAAANFRGPETHKALKDQTDGGTERTGKVSAESGLELDPIIRGLISRLPPRESVWPIAERDLWLSILKSSFQLVYKDASKESTTD
jgi:hypothetical protein